MDVIKTAKVNKKEIKISIRSDADLSVFHEIITDREYKHLEDHLKKTALPVIDIGAHIGVFAVYAAALNPKIKIFSYEPDEQNYDLLKKNLKQNRVKNVFTKQLIISDTIGQATFYTNADSHNHSIVPDLKGQQHTIQKTSATLEKITKFPKYSLLKVDCEGAEYPIFASAKPETLQKFQNIYIEYHNYKPENNPSTIINKLQQSGFKTLKTPSHYDSRMGFILATRI